MSTGIKKFLDDVATMATEIDVSVSHYTTKAGLLYVGTTGNVVVDPLDGGTDVTFANFPAGQFLPVAVKKVSNTSTASDLVIVE